MLRAERALAEIRVRLKLAPEGDVAAQSRADVHRLVRAVDGILTLHQPAGRGGCRSCARRRRFRGWPCATVRTVSRALDTAPVTCARNGVGHRPAEEVAR